MLELGLKSAANAVNGYKDLLFTCASVIVHSIHGWHRLARPLLSPEKLLLRLNSVVGLIPSTGAHCLSDSVRRRTLAGMVLRTAQSVLALVSESDNRLFRLRHQIRCLAKAKVRAFRVGRCKLNRRCMSRPRRL